MNKNTLILIIILILAIVGIYFCQQSLLQVKDYKNISYNIEGKDVLLTNGLSEVEIVPGSASKSITRYFGNEVRGDFNNDKSEDVAFLLTQDNGGSGTFYYVVAALKTNNGYIGTNGIFIGDHVAPQTTEFRDNMIIVNYEDREINQPMTAQPSIGFSKYCMIENGKLIDKE